METHEDSELHEDPDRLPDGIPHAVIALTAGYAVLIAIALVIAFAGDHPVLGALAAVITPTIVWKLVQKSERERDVVHPSR
jgi:hypothetical protein